MHRTVRRLFGAAVVAGTAAVGLTTHDAGFTFITLAGGLLLPRILGLGGHRDRHTLLCAGRHGTHRLEQRIQDWRRPARGESTAPPASRAY